ncbi:MAG: hypothetical protein U9Q72_03150 [Patescibacteria group bacterium]|nr:hypothetical protein [Patescibacteria group bacterium]
MIKTGDTMACQFNAVGKFTVSFAREGILLRTKDGDSKYLIAGGETTAFDLKRVLEALSGLDLKLLEQGEDFLLFKFVEQEK